MMSDLISLLHTFFSSSFQGNAWYEYRGRRLLREGTLDELGFPITVRKIDAAFVWDRNSRTYFFAGNDYYRYNENFGRLDRGYPKPIMGNWVGIPGNLDASFTHNGR